jgi:secreted trypsin-like serine protease
MGPRDGTRRRWGGLLLIVAALCGSLLVSTPATTSAQPDDNEGSVVGGVPLPDDVRPAVAALLIPNGQGDPFSAQFCTGVLISTRVVATTAACVTDNEGSTLPGNRGFLTLVDESDTNPPVTGVISRIDGVSRHPGFDATTSVDDLALLRLAAPVPSNRATPLPLADPSSYPPPTLATVTGWGSTDATPDNANDFPSRLHAAQVPITSDQACDDAYPPPDLRDDTTVCAGGTGISGPCQFDGGAPLTVRVGDHDELVGLASFGPVAGCTTFGRPDAYVELAGYASFLAAHLADVATPTFVDVRFGHPFLTEIWTLKGEGIVSGYPDGRFRSTAPVSRQAMAAFLHRLAGAPAGPFPDPGFVDVHADTPFFDEISWMADEGLSTPDADGRFRPSAPVSRAAMAAFLHRLDGAPAGPFPDPGFVDVNRGHPFFTAIAWMADTGITGGYPDGTFRPAAPVRRGPMAAFLARFEARSS